MWQQITTISETDTLETGTLIAKEDPDRNEFTTIYRVATKNNEELRFYPFHEPGIAEETILQVDALFTEGWWMMKKNGNQG
jgi:hypothetical protein